MEIIRTRSAAVAALVSLERVEAFAKIFVEETYDQDADGEITDEMQIFDGENIFAAERTVEQLEAEYNRFVSGRIDCETDGISVDGQVKYDMDGNLLKTNHQSATAVEATVH